MLYVYSFLLLTIYLINSQIGLPGIVVFIISACLYGMLYMDASRKYSQLVSVIIMMIVSLPFSWDPIWGGNGEASIITWFYIWTGVSILLIVLHRENNKVKSIQKSIILLSLFSLLYSFVPLLQSVSFTEGLKEFLMVGVFVLIMLVANLKNVHCNSYEKDILINIYIYSVFLICVGIIIQYVGFTVFRLQLFDFKLAYSWGGAIQTGCHLLMEDASSGTIMLGAGAMIAMINWKNHKWYIPAVIVIVIGMACTGRRTGALTLILVMGVYFVIGIKGIKRKALSLLAFGVLSVLMIKFMSASRAITNVAQMLYNNNRFKLWLEGVQLFAERPLVGYGLDNVYLEKVLMPSKMIVHNTIIRWLDMGGLIYSVPLILIVILWLILLKKMHQDDLMWAVLYSSAGSMLIPDLLNARFIYVLVLISLLFVNAKKGDI